MYKVCEWCGHTFNPRDARSKLCSDNCRKESKRFTARKQSNEWYDITIKDLKLKDVANILAENKITFEEYMKNREKYVFDYLYGGSNAERNQD